MENVKEFLMKLNLQQYAPLFEVGGYDDMDVILSCMTSEKLMEIGITKSGHRDKIMLAIERSRPTPSTSISNSTNASETKSYSGSIEDVQARERERLGYFPFPKGERTRYYNKIFHVFYEAARSSLSNDEHFREEFSKERKRQYDLIGEREKLCQCLDFCMSSNPSAHGRYLKEDYIPKPHDTRSIKQSVNYVRELQHKCEKICDHVQEHDAGLFKTGGLVLKNSYFSFHHNFNTDFVKTVHKLSSDVLQLAGDLEKKQIDVEKTFIGMNCDFSHRKSRLQKQNKYKALHRKTKRRQNQMLKVAKLLVPQLRDSDDKELLSVIDKGHLRVDMVSAEDSQVLVKRNMCGLEDLINKDIFSRQCINFMSNAIPDALQSTFLSYCNDEPSFHSETCMSSSSDSDDADLSSVTNSSSDTTDSDEEFINDDC